jgi:hypothetical protein
VVGRQVPDPLGSGGSGILYFDTEAELLAASGEFLGQQAQAGDTFNEFAWDAGTLSWVIIGGPGHTGTVHALGGPQHTASPLAALNALITDADLDATGTPRPALEYAGTFTLPAITTTEIPVGKWGFWINSTTSEILHVVNVADTLYGVEVTIL